MFFTKMLIQKTLLNTMTTAYITYINFTVNNVPEMKRSETVDLKDLYINKFNEVNFPITTIPNITINAVEVCSSNKGCAPKRNKSRSDYLVVGKDVENTYGSIKTEKNKFVQMNVKGTIKIGSAIQNIHLRIPRSGIIKFTIGFTYQDIINLKSNNVNTQLNNFIHNLANVSMGFFSPYVPYTGTKDINIIAFALQGINLFNPTTGQYPEHKISNFKQVVNELSKWTSKKKYITNYDKTDDKRIHKVYFKHPDPDMPTLGISQWGMLDSPGVKDLNFTNTYVIPWIIRCWNRVKPQFQYNTTSKAPKTKKMTPIKVNISSIPKKIVNIPVKLNNKLLYKGKEFKCMNLKKPMIIDIAKKLGVNHIGKKEDICKFIKNHFK